jgi:hypothetical protein
MAVSEAARPARSRPVRIVAVLVLVIALLFGVPWLTIVVAGAWPAPIGAVGAVLFGGAAPGHARGRDAAARAGDTLLGAGWVLFTWSVAGNVLRLVLMAFGVANAARISAVAAIVVAAALLAWGHTEAMRVPRIKRVPVTVPRLGPGLDGVRVVMLTDTHYGPIDRAAWSAKVAETVNGLGADIVCHVGDIADGPVSSRTAQVAPLEGITAALARVYVTGNHEYFGDAVGWLDKMRALGWQTLHNEHVVVERGGDRLVLAGIDDFTARSSGAPGHGSDLDTALDGTDPDLPVLLLAHQPKQITLAEAAGVDLQISGHTHGGQIWPFHHLVRIDQPSVSGLTRRTDRTQLYTSRGTGFWGPPFRIFAPSEITVITLNAGA